MDTYLWLLIAAFLFFLSFSLPPRPLEPRARVLLAAALAGLVQLEPGLLWLGVLGVVQVLPVLFVLARLRAAHLHLLRWIDLCLVSASSREALKLYWLERYLLRNGKPPPVQVSALQALVSDLVLGRLPTGQPPGEGGGHLSAAYRAWSALEQSRQGQPGASGVSEELRPLTRLSPEWFTLLGSDPARAQQAARALRLSEGFWTGRAWFLEGQARSDPASMQQGAKLMLAGLSGTLELYAFKRHEAQKLLAPYGVTFDVRAERQGGVPLVTVALIAACVGMFFWESRVDGIESNQTFLLLGANLSSLSLGPEPWRLLTSAFLHAGFLHIGLNMFYLWSFGSALERRIGPSAMLFLYVLSALVGSYFSAAFGGGNRLSVGASGAIFGVVAALSVVGEGRLGQRLGRLVAALPNLAIMLGFGFLIPNVDNWAHLGGLLAGLALGLAYARPRLLESAVFGGLALAGLGWAFWSLVQWQRAQGFGLF